MSLTFEERVSGLMRTCNVDRARAEQLARRSLNLPEPTQTPAEIERDERIAEDKEQHEVVKMFRAYGLKVYNLSQKRAAKQTPGLADLYVTKKAAAIAFWFETKRQVGGELSSAQVDFRDENQAAGVRWYSGDRYHAAEALVALGLAVHDGAGVNGISPRQAG